MLTLSFLGPMTLRVDGEPRPLPASRKTRALLAYLALEPRRHRRERLCELLWEIPDDPRAALRWSLAKLRPLLDRPERILSGREDVALDRDGMRIDVEEVRAALAAGPSALPDEALFRLFDAASEPFLDGTDLPAQPLFQVWIGSMRHEMAAAARAIGEALLARPLPMATKLSVIDRLLAREPNDARLHALRIALLEAGGDPVAAAGATRLARQLVGEVSSSAAADLAAHGAALAPAPAPAAARANLPEVAPGILARVAVHPFSATGTEAIAQPLAGLVAAGIAGSLARFGNLEVVEGSGTELPGTYAVTGSVVQAAGRVKVRCRLADPAGAILWSARSAGRERISSCWKTISPAPSSRRWSRASASPRPLPRGVARIREPTACS